MFENFNMVTNHQNIWKQWGINMFYIIFFLKPDFTNFSFNLFWEKGMKHHLSRVVRPISYIVQFAIGFLQPLCEDINPRYVRSGRLMRQHNEDLWNGKKYSKHNVM